MIDKINEVHGASNVNGVKSKRWGLQGSEEAAVAQDGLAVSPFAREMAAISAEMAKVPEIREDRVRDVKRRIEEGTYNPDLKELAARLVWAGINRIED
jgi:negative regulator of flagellin synthesis FlgM